MKEEDGDEVFFDPFFRVELIAFAAECGWNLANSLSLSYKYWCFNRIKILHFLSLKISIMCKEYGLIWLSIFS